MVKDFKVERQVPEPDRRSGDERRQERGPFAEANRRRSIERRGMQFGVLFATTRAIWEIEEWLEQNCHGLWNVTLEGIDDNLEKKTIRILFMMEDDKMDFVRTFGR